jgi:hypothetical protein
MRQWLAVSKDVPGSGRAADSMMSAGENLRLFLGNSVPLLHRLRRSVAMDRRAASVRYFVVARSNCGPPTVDKLNDELDLEMARVLVRALSRGDCSRRLLGTLRQRRTIRRRWRLAIQRFTHTIKAATAAPDIRVKSFNPPTIDRDVKR